MPNIFYLAERPLLLIAIVAVAILTTAKIQKRNLSLAQEVIRLFSGTLLFLVRCLMATHFALDQWLKHYYELADEHGRLVYANEVMRAAKTPVNIAEDNAQVKEVSA